MIDCDTTSWKASFQAFGSSTYVCYNKRSLSHCGRSRGPNRVVIVKCIVSVLKYDISTYAWYKTFQKNIQSDIELKLTNLFLCWNSRNKKYAVSIRFLIYKIIPNLIISEIIHVKKWKRLPQGESRTRMFRLFFLDSFLRRKRQCSLSMRRCKNTFWLISPVVVNNKTGILTQWDKWDSYWQVVIISSILPMLFSVVTLKKRLQFWKIGDGIFILDVLWSFIYHTAFLIQCHA